MNYSNIRRNRFIGGYVHNGVVFQYVSDSTFVWCSTLYVVYNIFNTSVTTPVIPPNALFHSSISSLNSMLKRYSMLAAKALGLYDTSEGIRAKNDSILQGARVPLNLLANIAATR